MNTQEDWVIIGRFGRPHGVKGFVSVHSFTEPRDNILSYEDWHVFTEQKWQPIKIVSVQVHNKGIVALLEGYQERETVAYLTNVNIATHKSNLLPLAAGEYYWHQLIGMKVVNQQEIVLGEVVEILPTGSNDVLVVKGERRLLIPYLPDRYIVRVDEHTKTITADWEMDY